MSYLPEVVIAGGFTVAGALVGALATWFSAVRTISRSEISYSFVEEGSVDRLLDFLPKGSEFHIDGVSLRSISKTSLFISNTGNVCIEKINISLRMTDNSPVALFVNRVSDGVCVIFEEGKFKDVHDIEIDYLNPQEYVALVIMKKRAGAEVDLGFRQPGVKLRRKRDFSILLDSVAGSAAISTAVSAAAAGGFLATSSSLLTVLRALLRY